MYLDQQEFIDLCIKHACDVPTILEAIRKDYPAYTVKPAQIQTRINRLRQQGLLLLDSGNKVDPVTILKRVSTVYDGTGAIKRQTLHSEVPKQNFLEAYTAAIEEIAQVIPALPPVSSPAGPLHEDLATLYISNDIHFGALMWGEESGTDWDTAIATRTLQAAYDYLFESTPASKIGIVCDLGDLMEINDATNMTPKSGHILAVDSRYPKILRSAYEGLVYAIRKALVKHELVYFYNIVGNHDRDSALAVREVIRMTFMDNPRVIVDDTAMNIKYHQHGTTLLQFAHGDDMKMRQSGEAMAVDRHAVFSSTMHRYAHFGHTHKDAVVDLPLCRAESHRNIAPLNHWAYNNGYRANLGTMKAITYDATHGEISRNIFNVNMIDD